MTSLGLHPGLSASTSALLNDHLPLILGRSYRVKFKGRDSVTTTFSQRNICFTWQNHGDHLELFIDITQ